MHKSLCFPGNNTSYPLDFIVEAKGLLKTISMYVSGFVMDVEGILMMTSSNGNIFCVTGPLRGESTGHRWIPLTKASDAELWYFLWSVPEQTAEQTIEMLVIWDAITLIMTSL